jgi:hypothetical protein
VSVRRSLAAFVFASFTGCTLSMDPARVSVPPQVSLRGDPTRPVAIIGKALDPRLIEMAQPYFTVRLDPSRCAEAVVQGVSEELRKRGCQVTPAAADALEITFVHATIVPARWGVVCYIDITATTSEGYVRGFQGQAGGPGGVTACKRALDQCASNLLADAEIHAFLAGEPRPEAHANTPD